VVVVARRRVLVASVTVMLVGAFGASSSAAAKPVSRILVGHTVVLRGPTIKSGNIVACLIRGVVITARIPRYPGQSGKDLLTTPPHSLELRWLSRKRLRFSCT